MRITQGTFSFLPDLTDEEISAQVEYALGNGWAVSVEYSDDPHPRNVYWDMWGLPMFDLRDAAGVMQEITACREAFPNYYVRVNAFDAQHGVESMTMSFIVQRPDDEPGYRLTRAEKEGRHMAYTVAPYAAEFGPEGERYGTGT